MIRRLRLKFILINMALVAAVLLIVFGAIGVTTLRRQQGEHQAALKAALSREADLPPDRFQIGKGRPPGEQPEWTLLLSVVLNGQGEILSVNEGNVAIDQELLEEAVARALLGGEETGRLSDLGLMYRVDDPQRPRRIAFIDTTVSSANLRSLMLTLAFAGGLGLLAFFGISVFLANWALRPVERAWTQQRQFLADASHELKTPLTVILANLNILGAHGEEDANDRAKWLENTQTEATRMKKLVDDMLFLAKSDAVEAPVQRQRFSLSSLAWSCLLPFEPVAYEQGVTLSSDIESDLEVEGDPAQIARLIAILLDNAVKYAGPKGSAHLSLKTSHEQARIRVRNTGETIAPEQLTHIFERFYRTDKARSRALGGYGLGLSIAAKITEAHGGRIKAESGKQEGTVLTVWLPLKA